ncbi:hypothetical protein XANCAGTX0491_008299 [Xanthoria calcicola]
MRPLYRLKKEHVSLTLASIHAGPVGARTERLRELDNSDLMICQGRKSYLDFKPLAAEISFSVNWSPHLGSQPHTAGYEAAVSHAFKGHSVCDTVRLSIDQSKLSEKIVLPIDRPRYLVWLL